VVQQVLKEPKVEHLLQARQVLKEPKVDKDFSEHKER
jgi:hypothetical protein